MTSAVWIWTEDRQKSENQSVFFRRVWRVEEVRLTTIQVSADSRYKLSINGRHVGVGPLKGDRFRKYYDEIDITEYLIKGDNIIFVQVLRFPPDYMSGMSFKAGAVSVVSSSRGGFLLHCGDVSELNTSAKWRCYKDKSYKFVEAQESKYAGFQEEVDGNAIPINLQKVDFDDSEWQNAVEICTTADSRLGGVLYEWQLKKRDIPLLFEKTMKAKSVVKTSGFDFVGNLIDDVKTVIPAGEHWFDVDMGELVNAYVSIALVAHEMNDDAKIELVYSESYWQEDAQGKLFKGVRDDGDHGTIHGEKDVYRLRNGAQKYEPFWLRVFRYIRIKIKSKFPIEIHDLSFRLTGYPLDIQGEFEAGDSLRKIWEVSKRTLERCMLDTYVDCPYYEQMQYVMDTMIQMLLNYQLSTDDRLARKALFDFHSTRRPDGMICCNAPAHFDQIIPIFSIYYIDMVVNHYKYFGDKDVANSYVPTIMGILQYFLDRLNADNGLVGDTGYWRFIDWVDEWRIYHGTPVNSSDEDIFVYSQIVAYGLKNFIWLCEELSLFDLRERYQKHYVAIIENVNNHCFDEKLGYYITHPKERYQSQHAQIWAVLSGCVSGEKAEELMRRCVYDKKLLRCSYSMSFYLLRACEQAGIYNEFVEKWDPWHELLKLNVTTWPEDNVTARSDCHGWSSVPIYDLSATVMGLQPSKPGFEELLLKPHSPELGDMKILIPTIRGDIKAKRTIDKLSGGYCAYYSLKLPPGMNLHALHPDGTEEFYSKDSLEISFYFHSKEERSIEH